MKKGTKQALGCFSLMMLLLGVAWAYQLYTVHRMTSRPLATRELGSGVSVEVWWNPHYARVPMLGWLEIYLPQGVSARYRVDGVEYEQSLDIVEDAFKPHNMPESIREILDGRR